MKHISDFYKNKRVLVTGGAGFIGSHLVEKLVDCGARVSVLDNFSSGSLNNLKNVLPYVSIFYADICSQHSLMKATTRQDIVFHLAAFTSVQGSFEHQELCKKINVQGTRLLLDACYKNDVKNVVFSSSCAIYGSKSTPCHEDDQPHPESPYAESKLAGEELCKAFYDKYLLSIAILRYFNVFGPRQGNSNLAAVVTRFTSSLLSGNPITIFGTGQQTRDFIDVADVILANLIVGASFKNKAEIFNVGSGKSMNLFELIDYLEAKLQAQRSSIVFHPARQGDIEHSHAQCDRFSSLLQKARSQQQN